MGGARGWVFMNFIKYPSQEQIKQIIERPHLDVSQLNATVASVLADVKENGDKAVIAYEEKPVRLKGCASFVPTSIEPAQDQLRLSFQVRLHLPAKLRC